MKSTSRNTANDNTASEKKVIIIPATKSLHPERDNITPTHTKIRVAAYCRVSTSLEEQQGSFKLQKEYYEKLISANPAWELAGIYGDEGKSGTSMRGRIGFLEMMDDVRAGKIDYIITKATSRFGRNTAEFIEVLDELESFGVEVLFESEGIVTSGQQNRTMLQVMGATNEHYSNTLSNNVRWSKERKMKEGKVTICYTTFLGYKKGLNGEPEIVPKEAEIVKKIFDLFLTGQSYASIARTLNDEGLTTKTGKLWIGESVRRILLNEKYTGDVLLQKTYKKSYLDKSCTKNRGEKPQVLVENNHPAIIDKTTYAKVKELIRERAKRKNYGTSTSPLIGKIICSECGSEYGHRVWNSRGHIKYDMWVCNHKYSEESVYLGTKCKTPNLRQEWIKWGYVLALNLFLVKKADYSLKLAHKLEILTKRLEGKSRRKNVTKRKAGDKPLSIDAEIKAVAESIKAIDEKREALDHEYELSFGRNDEYAAKKEELKNEMQQAISKKAELENEKDDLMVKITDLKTIITAIKNLPSSVSRFSDQTFTNTIDNITVNRNSLSYNFYGGEQIKVKLEILKNHR